MKVVGAFHTDIQEKCSQLICSIQPTTDVPGPKKDVSVTSTRCISCASLMLCLTQMMDLLFLSLRNYYFLECWHAAGVREKNLLIKKGE